LFGRFAEQAHGVDFVLCRAVAFGIHQAETVFGWRIALVGGLAEPLRGLGFIFRHPAAFGIQQAQVALRRCEALFGSLEVPRHCKLLVPGQTASLEIHRRKVVLRTRNALLRGLAIPVRSFRSVRWDALAIQVRVADRDLRLRIASCSAGAQRVEAGCGLGESRHSEPRDDNECRQSQTAVAHVLSPVDHVTADAVRPADRSRSTGHLP
jgi:hypothetical protein